MRASLPADRAPQTIPHTIRLKAVESGGPALNSGISRTRFSPEISSDEILARNLEDEILASTLEGDILARNLEDGNL